MSDPLEKAGQALGVVKQVLELAADTPDLKEAGAELAKSALALTKFINVALLPIAAVNFGYDKARAYFFERFKDDLTTIMKEVVAEDVIEPKPSIAAPLLQGLAFSHDEKALREMYLNLLATAMNSKRQTGAHPAFVEIIRQLSSKDALIFQDLAVSSNMHSAASIKVVFTEVSGERAIWRHLLPYNFVTDEGDIYATGSDPDVPTIIDNLARLGLIDVRYDKYVTGEGAYDWVPQSTKHIELLARPMPNNQKIEFDRGCIELTDFGRAFANAVKPA